MKEMNSSLTFEFEIWFYMSSFSDLHLYDFSDEVNQLPEDVLQMGGGMEDVEARMVAELERHRKLEFENNKIKIMFLGGAGHVVRLRDEDLRGANPLMMFLQSLLPWVQRETGNEHE